MIEVQKFDGSFVLINPNFIVTMKSDATKRVTDDNGNTYEVNDFINGNKFTIELVTGESMELSKLGILILRQRLQRADFDPNVYKHSIRMLRQK